MSSGREGYQEEERLDPQAEWEPKARPGSQAERELKHQQGIAFDLGEPEKKLLEAIFGKTSPTSEIGSDEGPPWKKSFDPAVLATVLTNAGLPVFAACRAAVLVQRWAINHTPATQVLDDIDYEEKLRKKSFDSGVLATLVPSVNFRAAPATAELVQRWMQNHVPTTQIEEISILASAVIGDRDKATKWLSEANLGTDNRPPIDLIGEKDGYDRVKNLLLRIEYGALA